MSAVLVYWGVNVLQLSIHKDCLRFVYAHHSSTIEMLAEY